MTLQNSTTNVLSTSCTIIINIIVDIILLLMVTRINLKVCYQAER